LPPASRSAFLEHCARELALLPAVGDGAVHRVVRELQRLYFEPPSGKTTVFEHHGPRAA
jgi:hypothetical protein